MGSREKVLQAATAVFGKNGYQATSIDSILEVAKVAPSNFYYHFKSKEELAHQVLEGYIQHSRREFAPVFVNKKLTAREKLEQFLRLSVQKMSQSGCCGGCPMGNLAQELSDSHPGFRQRIAEFFDEIMEQIAGVIRQGVESGEFRRDLDPRAAAYLIFGSLEGLILVAKSMKKVEPIDLGLRQALELLRK